MEFSFSASGWLFIYQLGVARTFQLAKAHTPEICKRCTGSSGGSLVSGVLSLDADLNQVKNYLLNCVAECKDNPRVNSFRMREYVQGAFELIKESFEEKEFYQHEAIAAERLGVSVTTLPNCKNHILTDFSSQIEIEEAILGSCTMSPLAGFPFKMNRIRDRRVHGKYVFDGGLSNIQPHVFKEKEKIVTVSVFSHWDSDIRPSRYVPIWWTLHPSSVENMEALYFLGMHDAERYLNEHSARFPKGIVTGEKLSRLVADEENHALSDFDQRDTKMGRRAPSFSDVEEEPTIQDKATDAFVVFSQKNIVKTLALTSIYAEKGYLTIYNLSKSLVLSAEQQRRNLVSPSQHGLSIRRWLPDSFVGSPGESFRKSVENVKSMLQITKLWKQLGDVDEETNPTTGHAKDSFVYKNFYNRNSKKT